MAYRKRIDKAFNGVIVAFEKKYGKESHRFKKDLRNLIKMRENQMNYYMRDKLMRSSRISSECKQIISDIWGD